MLTYFSWNFVFFFRLFLLPMDALNPAGWCRFGASSGTPWPELELLEFARGHAGDAPCQGRLLLDLENCWHSGSSDCFRSFFLLSSDLVFHVFFLSCHPHCFKNLLATPPRLAPHKAPPKVRPRDIYWTAAAKWHRLSSGSKQDVVHEWHKIWPNCQRIPAALADVRPIRFFTRGARGRRIGRAESGQGCVVWPELGLQMCVLKLSSHKNKILSENGVPLSPLVNHHVTIFHPSKNIKNG